MKVKFYVRSAGEDGGNYRFQMDLNALPRVGDLLMPFNDDDRTMKVVGIEWQLGDSGGCLETPLKYVGVTCEFLDY